jgi:hypothetical protein
MEKLGIRHSSTWTVELDLGVKSVEGFIRIDFQMEDSFNMIPFSTIRRPNPYSTHERVAEPVSIWKNNQVEVHAVRNHLLYNHIQYEVA